VRLLPPPPVRPRLPLCWPRPPAFLLTLAVLVPFFVAIPPPPPGILGRGIFAVQCVAEQGSSGPPEAALQMHRTDGFFEAVPAHHNGNGQLARTLGNRDDVYLFA